MRCDGVPNVGEDVACRLSDGRAYRCRVVERRLARTPPIASTRADARADANGSAGAAAYEYYVHPRGLNRRLDEWVMDCRLLDASALHAHGDQAAHSASAPPRARAGPSGAHADAPSQPSTRVQLSPALTTRKMKRRIDVLNNVSASELDFDPRDEEQHEQETKVKHIRRVVMGPFEIETWYFSPYPDEYGLQPLLFICEYSLKYFKHRRTYEQQRAQCTRTSPPGTQIYQAVAPRSSSLPSLQPPSHLTVWEVDGRIDKVFCQCLCLLAKLFLDHKTLYYDTDPFLFYALCEADVCTGRHRIVGYFSKERDGGNSLACILVLPPHQRKGYGKLLISLSHELCKRQGTCGSPERPLSDLGLLTFRSYWSQALIQALAARGGSPSLRELSDMTAICTQDALETLQELGALKYVKGEHVVCLTPQAVDDWLRMHGKRQLTIDAALLRCAPTPPLPPPPPTADGGAAPFCTMAACAAAAAPAAAHSPAERSAGAGVVAAPAATARGAPAAGQGGSTGRVKGNPASHGMPTARARALSARASGVSALGLVARTGSRAPAARCAPLARTGKA
ncbi:hypothetical protein KFE25_001098 [Diacronema lutheri]|uniref:histone acetyltransferase n=2 Tax=Diacronema lutheri TaxID=2081491 RepID=A0A8J5XJ17_DIALT|nr:hypothetical protein KFE25_001098 [Diacronema lutheri]